MFSFKDKSWWKSKTFWTAVVTAIVSAVKVLNPELVTNDIFIGILGVLVSFGLVAQRDAIGKSGSSK